MHDIAIIGFGATGVSFLRQLHSHFYEQDLNPISVAIISPKESFSSGLAFGQAESFHRVNTPPELMGIDPEDPQGFATWMRQKKGLIEKYPSRLTYSDYLKYVYRSLPNDKLIITEYHSLANNIEKTNKQYRLNLNDGRTIKAKRTVLALGSTSAPSFSNNLGLEPILPSEIPQTPTPNRALVIGTGLTSVDCVRSLARKGTQSIHIFSRSGFAPTVISRSASYNPENFIWDKLKAGLKHYSRGNRLHYIISLIKDEMKSMGDHEVTSATKFLKKEDLISYWDYLIDRSENSNLPFQDTLTSTRFYAHKIWRKLDENEQLRFQLKFGSFWACWRHPIPTDIALELQQYAKEGRLHIHRPTAPLRKSCQKYHLETKQGRIISDLLVDGTGGSNDMSESSSTLIRNLLANRLAIPHPCGGLRVDTLTFGLQSPSSATGIYCIGPLGKGSLFSTNAFWFNSLCAEKLAYYLTIEMRLESNREFSI